MLFNSFLNIRYFKGFSAYSSFINEPRWFLCIKILKKKKKLRNLNFCWNKILLYPLILKIFKVKSLKNYCFLEYRFLVNFNYCVKWCFSWYKKHQFLTLSKFSWPWILLRFKSCPLVIYNNVTKVILNPYMVLYQILMRKQTLTLNVLDCFAIFLLITSFLI